MTTVPFRSKRSALGVLQRLTGANGDAPLSAMIEVADRCNEVCVHCYQIQGQKGELDTDDWRAILDELAEMGVLFLTISGGEATLRHDFLELVEHARSLKFAVKLFTNGLTMDEAMADALARLAVQEVQISLYSPRAEVHDWVTKVPGSFDKVVRAVELLVERGVAVVVKSVLTSFNFDDREAYRELATRLGADYMLDPSLDPRENGDRGPQAFDVSSEQWLDIHSDPTLFPRREELIGRPLDSSVCGACSGSIHIEANGEVHPCTQLEVSVGSAVTQGVRAAWGEGDDAQAIRSLTWRAIHGCRDCDLRSHCSHCFANALKEGGDALGPYESMCRVAKLHYESRHGVRPVVVPTAGSEGRLGPYRLLPGHRLELKEDRRSPGDVDLAERLGWTRGDASQAPDRSGPGDLVQIRRPGAKVARPEAVPGGGGSTRSTEVGERGVDPRASAGHTHTGLDFGT